MPDTFQSPHSASQKPMTPLMQTAFEALGREKIWEGTVSGCGGLIRRTFRITSRGTYANAQLTFTEQIEFNDGVANERQWIISEQDDGLNIVSDGIKLLRPGRIEKGVLLFDYRLKLGRFSLPYKDQFVVAANGTTLNTGHVTLFRVPIMKITATGKPAM